MRKIAIKVKHLSKTFQGKNYTLTVIEDASFEIYKGELVALVAPSGAGKTTLLLMLGCVEEPSGGKIILGKEKVYDNGWLIKNKEELRRKKIGFIFQAHYLIAFLTILENIILLPLNNGVPKEEAKANALRLLEYFDIKDKANAYPFELSGGQNQRAAIARALINKPQIVLADEPTAALDSKRSVAVVKMLKKIAQEQNVAVVMVTHDERMLPFCDRILTIENKKVLFKEKGFIV